MWFSQTGQLGTVLDTLVQPLAQSGWRVERHEIVPRAPFPFPWSLRQFVSVFPAAADPTADIEVQQIELPPCRPGDLLIIGAQVWFLAPSLPVRAMISRLRPQLRGRDVLVVFACRNMWYAAALDLYHRITDAGGRHLGTVAATDTHAPEQTMVTTLRWLITGRSEAFGRFPPAGVGPDEYARLERLGRVLAEQLAAAASDEVADHVRVVLANERAAPIDVLAAAVDLAVTPRFQRWSSFIRAASPPAGLRRRALLVSFVVWLLGTVLSLPIRMRRLAAAPDTAARVAASLEPVVAGAGAGP
ncbi:hypothetical protein AW168_31390 [Nocardia brasiliensis]|uniref:Dialkylrecorsinol condensing enzyme n=1 Tax=Nocardia brasiliensis (strain ATCC 700358 / HUJEG-1) TaxID=1133849 RepID=K0ERA0_NOCB7|nr:hypothetical protein O3I_010630 [Nocardia brasiliensis ATCC 700358]OCF86278.1 hypothetical protein AW168_31390 [Nocardia brasiliensis]